MELNLIEKNCIKENFWEFSGKIIDVTRKKYFCRKHLENHYD